MSWAKLDDRFLMNPKIMSAGLEGRALYLAGLLYSAGELTNGKIPLAAVRKLAALSDVEDADLATQRLLNLNLWERDEETGGYIVHDYLEYNPSAAVVHERKQDVSQKRAAAGSKGAEKRWQAHGNIPQNNSNVIANEWQNDSKTDGKSMAPREDGKPIAPSPSPSPSPSRSRPNPEPEGAALPLGGGNIEKNSVPFDKKQAVPENAVKIFIDLFTEKVGEPPDIPPRFTKALKEVLGRVREPAYRAAICAFLSDDWASESGYSVNTFVSQPINRWTLAKPNRSKNGNSSIASPRENKFNRTAEAIANGW